MKGSVVAVGIGIIAGNALLYGSLQKLYESNRQPAVILVGLLAVGLAYAVAMSVRRNRLITALLVLAVVGVALQFLPMARIL